MPGLGDRQLLLLREQIGKTLENLNTIFAKNRMTAKNLPPQSKKAYDFLKSIDFESIRPTANAQVAVVAESITFGGLNSYLDHILEQLAVANTQDKLKKVHDSITYSTNSIEAEIKTKNIKPEQLKPAMRAIRGWLAYFSDSDALDNYMQAVERAKNAFEQALRSNGKPECSMIIHFCPVKAMYSVRYYKNRIIAKLPIPMISFDEETFKVLAETIFHKKTRKKNMHDVALGKDYQRISSEIEMLAGVVEKTNGLCHNLQKSFDRVNEQYFANKIEKPVIAWSRTFTYRKMGHYDHVHDRLVVSSSLDEKIVPEFVIDFVMYHEVLHKHLGVRWLNGRKISHSPQFYQHEKAFRQYAQAKEFLSRHR